MANELMESEPPSVCLIFDKSTRDKFESKYTPKNKPNQHPLLGTTQTTEMKTVKRMLRDPKNTKFPNSSTIIIQPSCLDIAGLQHNATCADILKDKLLQIIKYHFFFNIALVGSQCIAETNTDLPFELLITIFQVVKSPNFVWRPFIC